MPKPDQTLLIREKITAILKHSGVLRAGMFGSIVRGELHKNSDIDILVELGPAKTLLDLVELKQSLEKALKRRVDLVEYSVIHPLLKKRILKEQVSLL
ncbi:MAG: nucleotidyltransferase family protein [Deltaproteobacteria bacterium]|nr:nucleotidyltransferase family protein [Deltaproteobacteria bacterium]MBI5809753.1 nucleotidyltransferase family protein [Deltaproteobacteria bacterium]